MKIEFTKRAKRDLKSLPRKTTERILKKLNFYSKQEEPLSYGKALKGISGEYRFRIGDYRVIFDKKGNTIFILRIAKRDEIY